MSTATEKKIAALVAAFHEAAVAQGRVGGEASKAAGNTKAATMNLVAAVGGDKAAELIAADMAKIATAHLAANPKPADAKSEEHKEWRKGYMAAVVNPSAQASLVLAESGKRIAPSFDGTVKAESVKTKTDDEAIAAAFKSFQDAVKRLPKECMTAENFALVQAAWTLHVAAAKSFTTLKAEAAARSKKRAA